jgi:hypothetical protein
MRGSLAGRNVGRNRGIENLAAGPAFDPRRRDRTTASTHQRPISKIIADFQQVAMVTQQPDGHKASKTGSVWPQFNAVTLKLSNVDSSSQLRKGLYHRPNSSPDGADCSKKSPCRRPFSQAVLAGDWESLRTRKQLPVQSRIGLWMPPSERYHFRCHIKEDSA